MFALLRTIAGCGMAAALALPTAGYAVTPGDGTAYHIYRTPQQWAHFGGPPSATTGEMEYFAGSVFSNVKVVSVMWGSTVNPTTVKDIGGFLTAIVNSTYVDQLSIYDTNIKGVNGRQGTDQTIGRGTYLGQVQITPEHKGKTISDKQIRSELAYQIKNGVLPANDPNTLYMIYFPKSITITLDKLTSCSSFGAYHEASSSKPSASNIFYGVMPDCGFTFNELTIVSSHEYAEATTDNIPTPGSHPHYPQAWNTATGYEIGDLCEGTQGTLTTSKTTYDVQEIYLNSTGACGTGNFTSP